MNLAPETDRPFGPPQVLHEPGDMDTVVSHTPPAEALALVVEEPDPVVDRDSLSPFDRIAYDIRATAERMPDAATALQLQRDIAEYHQQRREQLTEELATRHNSYVALDKEIWPVLRAAAVTIVEERKRNTAIAVIDDKREEHQVSLKQHHDEITNIDRRADALENQDDFWRDTSGHAHQLYLEDHVSYRGGGLVSEGVVTSTGDRTRKDDLERLIKSCTDRREDLWADRRDLLTEIANLQAAREPITARLEQLRAQLAAAEAGIYETLEQLAIYREFADQVEDLRAYLPKKTTQPKLASVPEALEPAQESLLKPTNLEVEIDDGQVVILDGAGAGDDR